MFFSDINNEGLLFLIRELLKVQCEVGVLPLGTGNDLARVLGWGASCDDDTHLPQLLERYEKASPKILDRFVYFNDKFITLWPEGVTKFAAIVIKLKYERMSYRSQPDF